MQHEARALRMLIYKRAKGVLTAEESARLADFMHRSSQNEELVELMSTEEGLEHILQEIKANDERWEGVELTLPVEEVPVKRFLGKNAWFRLAAASVVVVAAGAIFFFNNNKAVQPAEEVRSQYLSSIQPGTRKATLTLADKSVIDLNDAKVGKLAREGGTDIQKAANGVIQYSATKEKVDAGLNELRTPVGGDYVIKLEDGTVCYVNAQSTLKYPAVFAGKERKVYLSGEAYFEVAKKSGQPFLVQTDKGTIVQVTGTTFNINTYPNEPAELTSLVEGSVSVMVGKETKQLKPGQEAAVNTPLHKFEVKEANLRAAISWTKGNFYYIRATGKEVMKQIERWYGIKAIFEDNIGDDWQLQGGFSRSIPLDEVMTILKKYDPELEYSLNDKRELTLYKARK